MKLHRRAKYTRPPAMSAITKKAKITKARTKRIRHNPYDENDVRNKDPKDWDEVMRIQQVFESVVNSFGRVTARPPPIASPWRSYYHQRAVFQQASDYYWRLERRVGPPPELAGLGLWHGPVLSIINAPVEIAEDDLEFATHPSVASYQPEEGSIAWLESNHNLHHVLDNQPHFNAYTQPPRTSQGLRTSPSQPASFRVSEEATREQMRTPYQLGALMARRLEGPVPEYDSQSMSPMGSDEPPMLPFRL